MGDHACGLKWGICHYYSSISGMAESHHCGEWYLKGVEHVHICDGCNEPKLD